jgi:hypothetical protein
VVDSLPGTVPPALVLLAFEVLERRQRAAEWPVSLEPTGPGTD